MKPKAKPEHDLSIDDLSHRDLSDIKSMAMQKFFENREVSQVPLVIEAFMTLLVSKGYSIKKVKDER